MLDSVSACSGGEGVGRVRVCWSGELGRHLQGFLWTVFVKSSAGSCRRVRQS